MLRRVASRSLVYLASGLFNRAIGAAVAIILTRFIEPSEYGVLAIAGSVTGVLAPLLVLGADSGVGIYRYTLTPAAYGAFLSALQRASIVIPCVFLALVDLFGRRFGMLVWPQLQWAPVMSVALAISYLSVWQGLAGTVMQADQEARRFALFGIIQGCLGAAATFLCVAYFDRTAKGVLVAQLLVFAVMGIASQRILSRRSARHSPDWSAFVRTIRVFLPVLPHGLCIWLLNLSDRWVLGRYASLDAVGIYSVGYAVGMLVLTVGGAQVQAFGPAYVEERSKPDCDHAALGRLTTVYAAGPIFLALSLSVLSQQILSTLSSPKYLGAVRYVPWICFAYAVLVAVYQTNLVVIQFSQRMSSLLLISVPATVLNVLLNLWFVPTFGAIAAAINTLIAFVYMAAASTLIRWRVDGRRPQLGPITRLFGIAIVVLGLASRLPNSGSAGLLVRCLLLAAAAASFLWTIGLIRPAVLWGSARTLRKR